MVHFYEVKILMLINILMYILHDMKLDNFKNLKKWLLLDFKTN